MPDSRGRALDNEGRVFVARAARRPFPDPTVFGDAALLECPDCRRREFRIAVAGPRERQPFLQLGCPCGFAWRPMEMRKAQMTDRVANLNGIIVPRPKLESVDVEFDVPNEMLRESE